MFVNVVVGSDGLEGGRDALALAEQLGAPRAAVVIAPGDDSVGRGLRRFAEIERADLIVIGSCQHGVFERATYRRRVLGTLHGAQCAVAIAPAGYAGRGGRVRLIGVGYDGSRESEHGLLVARDLGAATARR